MNTHDDDSVDSGGAYIGFSATNIKLEEPPEIGDELVLVVKVVCTADGNKLMADGELRPKRTLKVLWAGPAGSKPPTDPQAGLFDTNGEITKQAAGLDDDDEDDGEIEDDTDQDGGE